MVGDTQCGVPGLEPGRKYKFRVKAVNEEGESAPLVSDTETLAKDPWGKLTHPHHMFTMIHKCHDLFLYII